MHVRSIKLAAIILTGNALAWPQASRRDRNRTAGRYRFQSDNSSSSAITTVLFQDYKSFGGSLVATKIISRTGDHSQTVTFTSVTYEPLDDSLFELPLSGQDAPKELGELGTVHSNANSPSISQRDQ
jgi:hypothetical protein